MYMISFRLLLGYLGIIYRLMQYELVNNRTCNFNAESIVSVLSGSCILSLIAPPV